MRKRSGAQGKAAQRQAGPWAGWLLRRGKAEHRAGCHDVPADAVAVGTRGDRRELAKQTKDLLVADALRLVEIVALDGRVGLWVEGRHGGDGAHDHAHGMRIVAERLEVLRQVFMNECVPEHAHLPVAELGL